MAKRRRPEPLARIDSVAAALAVSAHDGVDCYLGKETGKRRQPARLTSGIGGAFWGRRGESWPTTQAGAPLMPWLLVRCDEVPRAGGPFHRRQAIAFYLDPGFRGFEASSSPDADAFVVRTYAPGERLVRLERPKALEGHPWIGIEWRPERDHPALGKYDELFAEDVNAELEARSDLPYANHSGIKIGGWPTPVQRSQQYPGTFDLQIDITSNFMYADSGVGFLRRSGDGWYVMFETL